MKYFEDNPNTETILAEKELIKRVKDERERVDLLGLATMVAFRKFKDSIIKELFYKEFPQIFGCNIGFSISHKYEMLNPYKV